MDVAISKREILLERIMGAVSLNNKTLIETLVDARRLYPQVNKNPRIKECPITDKVINYISLYMYNEYQKQLHLAERSLDLFNIMYDKENREQMGDPVGGREKTPGNI